MPDRKFSYAPRENFMETFRRRKAMEETLPVGQGAINGVFRLQSEAFQRAYPFLAGSEYMDRLLAPEDLYPVSYQTMRRREREDFGLEGSWLLDQLTKAGVGKRKVELNAFSVRPGVNANLYRFAGNNRLYFDRNTLAGFYSEDPITRTHAAQNLTEVLSATNIRLLCDEVDMTTDIETRRVAERGLVTLTADYKIPDEKAISILMSYRAKKNKRITNRGGLVLVYADKERADKGQSDFAVGTELNSLMIRYHALKVVDNVEDILREKNMISTHGRKDAIEQTRKSIEEGFRLGTRSGLFSNEETLMLTFILGALPQTVRDLAGK